jgi:hypothetical protein
VLHRPAAIPAPAPALKLLFGEASSTILGGQDVPPDALRRAGYQPLFPQLGGALEDALDASVIVVTDPEDVPDHPYLEQHRPHWELRSALDVAAPVDAVVAYFSQPENLPMVTPPANALAFKTLRRSRCARERRSTTSCPIAGLRAAWRTEVVTWDPPRSFVDIATKGPFRLLVARAPVRADGDGDAHPGSRAVFGAARADRAGRRGRVGPPDAPASLLVPPERHPAAIRALRYSPVRMQRFVALMALDRRLPAPLAAEVTCAMGTFAVHCCCDRQNGLEALPIGLRSRTR